MRILLSGENQQETRGVHIIKQLAAEFKVELAAELGAPRLDMLKLEGQ